MGTGPISCLLLGISSDYARPITGQVTEVTWPVIGWAQPEFTPSDTRKTSPGVTIVGSPFTFHQSPPPLHTPTPPPPPPPPKPLPGAPPPWSPPVMAPDASQHPTIAVSTCSPPGWWPLIDSILIGTSTQWINIVNPNVPRSSWSTAIAAAGQMKAT